MDKCCFVCKQETAYEMRISDWSSDVCSSDLTSSGLNRRPGKEEAPQCKHQVDLPRELQPLNAIRPAVSDGDCSTQNTQRPKKGPKIGHVGPSQRRARKSDV